MSLKNTAYKRTNGRCAYCGQPVGLKEAQLDVLMRSVFDGNGTINTADPLFICPACKAAKSGEFVCMLRLYHTFRYFSTSKRKDGQTFSPLPKILGITPFLRFFSVTRRRPSSCSQKGCPLFPGDNNFFHISFHTLIPR